MPEFRRVAAAATILLAISIVPLCSSVARADDIEAARQHYSQGSKHFDLGRYDEAIKEYMAAYDAKPDPALLYNIAQAHKLAGHAAEAIRFYRIYLIRVPNASNADEVRAKIVEQQKAIEQQQKAQAMPPDQTKPLGSVTPPPATAPTTTTTTPTPTTPTTTPPASPPTSSSSSTDAAQLTSSEAPRPGRSLRIAGVAAAGVGIAALAAGIGMSVVAKQDSDQVTMLTRNQGVFDPAKDSTGRTLGTAGPALIGVGAALTVAGGVVAILGWRAGRKPHVESTAQAADSVRF